MRKTQMALAAVALVASSAALADVTVSGRIDYAYAIDSKSTMTGIREGNLAPNFINVTGSEDLGGGMKASFNWVNLVNSSGGLVNANSNVGITNGIVGVKLGRVTDTFLKGVLAFDVTGGGNMGSAVSPILQFGATGAFHSNAIQADASVAGLNLEGTYIAQDGAAGTTGSKGDYSLSASTDLGALKLGGAYAVRSVVGSATNPKHWSVGAGTTLMDVTANLLVMDLNGTTVTGANAAYPLTSAITLTGGYYNYGGKAASNGELTSIGAKYAFSKATTAFVNYENVSGAAVAMQGSVTSAGGTNKSITMLGLAHSF